MTAVVFYINLQIYVCVLRTCDRKPLRYWMNRLSSWSQCCRMGVEQEVSHRRIVALPGNRLRAAGVSVNSRQSEVHSFSHRGPEHSSKSPAGEGNEGIED